jgi:hypothetical protein
LYQKIKLGTGRVFSVGNLKIFAKSTSRPKSASRPEFDFLVQNIFGIFDLPKVMSSGESDFEGVELADHFGIFFSDSFMMNFFLTGITFCTAQEFFLKNNAPIPTRKISEHIEPPTKKISQSKSRKKNSTPSDKKSTSTVWHPVKPITF